MVGDTSATGAGKRDRTRARLIAAALDVVLEKGFVGAGLDEIAARAGMTKGAIYANFSAKADLMFAVAESQSLTLQPAYVAGGTLADQLRATADALVATLPRVGGVERLIVEFQSYMLAEPELRRRAAAQQAEGLAALTAAVEANYADVLAMPAVDLVAALQALSLGVLHQHQLTPDAMTEQAIRSAFDALARGAVR